MRFVYIFSLLILANTSIYAQSKTVDKFAKAMWSESIVDMENLCTSHFWNNPNGSTASAFYNLSIQQDFKIERKQAQGINNRVIYYIDLKSRKGRTLREVYFYLVKVGDDWKIDGIDNDKNHFQYFLDEKVNGHFDPRHLEEDKDLHSLGDLFIKVAKGGEGDLKEKTVGDLTEYLGLIERVEDVEVEISRYSPKLDKGVIHFVHMYYDDHEDLSVYFHKVNGKWEPYTYSLFPPKSEDFYKQ